MDNATPIKRQTFSPFKRGSAKGKLIIPATAIILVVVILGILALRKTSQTAPTTVASTGQMSVKQAKATQTLNKTFSFPLKDDNGKNVSSIAYVIQSAELRDQIIVKGETATAIKGRTFLILNLKLVNNYTKPVQINARDYIRLIVNNAPEKLAADIHNDPVEVQAISTKYTRIGFPIDDNKANLKLQIGEITGSKQEVKLSL